MFLIVSDYGVYIAYTNDVLQYHRTDGPAVENLDGKKEWYKNGLLHREDGPAYISNSREIWYCNGRIHRTNGPAVEYFNGKKEWWEHDRLIRRT